MSPTRRDLLLACGGALAWPAVGIPRPGGPAPNAKHLIVVYAEGGWDVTFCLDPKLGCVDCSIEGPEVDADGSDRETVETFGALSVVVNASKRPSVAPFFERWHPRIHVVNGVWTGSIAHDPCRYRILTGTPDGGRPDLVSIAGATHGTTLPLGAVDLSGWGISGPLAASTGRVGANSQIAALLDDDRPFRAPFDEAPYPRFRAAPDDAAAIEAYLADRASALRGRFSDGGHNDRVIDDLIGSLDRAARFRDEASDILGSLTVGQSATFSSQIEMAVDLIAAGMCHAVTVDTRKDWDTHDRNVDQHAYWDDLCFGLGGLMQRLEDREMLDDVVVAVLSEMTRTPLRNAAGGKDHWGHTSAMLMGAVRTGTSGGTDGLLESLPVDLATGSLSTGGALNKYDNFAAGILDLVGVDPEPWLPGVVPFRGAHG